ncbi:unnamed protein product [Gadus morhua 'NCC']
MSWEMYMIINQEDSSTAPEEEDEVLLSPEVTYGPPGLDLSCPVALSVAHCADLSGPADATWAVRLKKRTPENKWEEFSFAQVWGLGAHAPAALLQDQRTAGQRS